MATKPRTKAETLAWLRTIAGELSTQTLKRLEDTLPWYGDMPPSRRSAVGLVAQAGISSFISWYDDPRSTPWIAADVFGAAPRELLRSVSLQQTLQLIRVTVEVVEERVKNGGGEELREAILLYSREIAFAAADVYARAAEARGLWDARLEALVVDSILSGEYDDELPSRSRHSAGTATARSRCSWARRPSSSTSTTCGGPPGTCTPTCSSACRATGSCS